MNAQNANNDARKNELSKDLWIKYGGYVDIDETIPYVDWDGIAEEILERERKIVEPLVSLEKKLEFKYDLGQAIVLYNNAIDETLKRAGLNS